MNQPTLTSPIMQARRLLATAIAAPDALTTLQNLDLQLAAGDLEQLWRGVQPPAEREAEPSQDVLGDLLRARELLLGEVEAAPDVDTAVLLADVVRQVQAVIDDLDPTSRS